MKARSWFIPITLGVLVTAVLIGLLRPVLVRRAALKQLHSLGVDTDYPSYPSTVPVLQPTWYWGRAERYAGVEAVQYVGVPAGVGDERSLSFLRELPELVELHLGYVDLEDAALAKLIRRLPNLEFLYFEGLAFGEQSSAALLELPYLKEAYLYHCRLTPEVREALALKCDYFAWSSPLPDKAHAAVTILGDSIQLGGNSSVTFLDASIGPPGLTEQEADAQFRNLLLELDPWHQVTVYVNSQETGRASNLLADITCTNLRVHHSSGDLSWLGTLKHVEKLTLFDTKELSGRGTLPPGLTSLDIDQMNGGEWPFAPGGLSRLADGQHLELLKVSLKPAIPAHAWIDLTATQIKRLRLPELTDDASLEKVSGMSSLEVLDLSYSAVTDSGLVHLAKLPALRVLDLGLTKVSDGAVDALLALPALEYLYLDYTTISDVGIAKLFRDPGLNLLSLRGTEVSDAVFAKLPSAFSIEHLNLHETKITDATLAHLARQSALRKLVLIDSGVTDQGVDILKSLPNLSVLYLDGTAVTDACLPSVRAMPSLRSLSLQQTSVTTILPLKGAPKLDWVGVPRGIPKREVTTLRAARPKMELHKHGLHQDRKIED